MNEITHEIKEYRVHFQAGPSIKDNKYPRTIIRCYNDECLLLEVNFYRGKKRIPENYYSINSKLVYLRYPMSMYGHVLDILRNEKPVYFHFYETSNKGYIRTGKEPVGEGEVEELELEGKIV